MMLTMMTMMMMMILMIMMMAMMTMILMMMTMMMTMILMMMMMMQAWVQLWDLHLCHEIAAIAISLCVQLMAVVMMIVVVLMIFMRRKKFQWKYIVVKSTIFSSCCVSSENGQMLQFRVFVSTQETPATFCVSSRETVDTSKGIKLPNCCDHFRAPLHFYSQVSQIGQWRLKILDHLQKSQLKRSLDKKS